MNQKCLNDSMLFYKSQILITFIAYSSVTDWLFNKFSQVVGANTLLVTMVKWRGISGSLDKLPALIIILIQAICTLGATPSMMVVARPTPPLVSNTRVPKQVGPIGGRYFTKIIFKAWTNNFCLNFRSNPECQWSTASCRIPPWSPPWIWTWARSP